MAPYPEKTLQLAALDWLKRQKHYREIYSDIEATGARIDSAGILNDRAVAIEVKVAISKPMVRHRSEVSGSLEAKISATLHALAGNIPFWLEPFQTYWRRDSYPIFIILAQHYSENGLTELKELLEIRSTEWQFGYEVWHWNGSEVVTLLSNTSNVSNQKRDLLLDIPTLTNSAKRALPRTIEEFRTIALGSGLEDIFDAFVAGARQHNLRLSFTRTAISLSQPKGTRKCVTLFVQGCDWRGFNTGIDMEFLKTEGSSLPGIEAPRLGYMNTNRYILSKEDVDRLLSLVTQSPSKFFEKRNSSFDS